MDRYNELGLEMESAFAEGNRNAYEELRQGGSPGDTLLLDLLMRPGGRAPVVKTGPCGCGAAEGKGACEASCVFDAIRRDKNGNVVIAGNCTGCGECLSACPENALSGRKDAIPVLELLKGKSEPVYAMIAPAFSGQFGSGATSGKLRSAFKRMGFYGMVEVAMFADILTLKEALEFDRAIQNDRDFLMTSCCCPLWVALIRKSYRSLIPHVPPSVSPMVACGRSIKKLHPGAKTVFIGPCLAKKAEAKEPDIADAVDYVLTFEEMKELFDVLKIDPKTLDGDESDHSSRAGRIYARVSGVSEAVQAALDRLRPNRRIPFRSQHADGVIGCKNMLKEISEGNIHANFIEGMGCGGGCVGGPKSLIDKETARQSVNDYGERAKSKTPLDNPHVPELLRRLGYHTVESLLDRDSNFTRIL